MKRAIQFFLKMGRQKMMEVLGIKLEKRINRYWGAAAFAVTVCAGSNLLATNPLILDQFTADPSARVFEGRVFVYPSHDILAAEGRGRPDWFCMEDYHVFSSDNLTDWKDHGVIVTQTAVDWVSPTSYSMWAPDCVFKNGKYYFYFPAVAKDGGFRIGAAIADKPEGPFHPEPKPIEGVRGIDPCVFIDKNGDVYLYYSAKKIFVAKMKDNMLELDGPVTTIENLPTVGLLEGPFVFERNGIYYLTYPHVENRIQRLEYATGASPLGPFKPAGVILDESLSGCWTVHHSIVEFQGQWYLFYHDRDLSPGFDKNRSIRADRLSFNDDSTIKKVVPTLRGVGLVKANSKIQIDRYSATSGEDVTASFLNSKNPSAGWKISLAGVGTWVRFNDVDFEKNRFQAVQVRAVSAKGGTIEIRLGRENSPVLARIEIGAGGEWRIFESRISELFTGVQDLVVVQTGGGRVDLDWIGFDQQTESIRPSCESAGQR